ncbi:MAG: ATP-binding protein [Pyrinomonadaceae bacterium]
MEEHKPKQKRRKTPWVVGTLMVASLALLIILQSTNLWKTFTIESSSDLLLLYALSGLNFIAFVIFGFIFLRSIVKLARERRTFELGAQIKTRLLIYFFAVSLLPIIAMAVFSYLFMNRGLERWFSQIPQNVIRGAQDLQQSTIEDRVARLDGTARMLAATIDDDNVASVDLSNISAVGRLAHIEIVGVDGTVLAVSDRELPTELQGELKQIIDAFRSGSDSSSFRDGKGLDAAIAEMSGGRRLMIVPDPVSSANIEQTAEKSLQELDRLGQQQFTIRRLGLLTLGVLTFLLIFASTWIAFYVARGLTAPIKALAEGAGEIAKGNLGHRVEVLAEDELAILVNAFNEMSTRLDANSAELTEGRRYIETVLESLPTGVISFGGDGKVNTINDAAATILGLDAAIRGGVTLKEITVAENHEVFDRLIARARRVGHASDQTVIKTGAAGDSSTNPAERTVAITVSVLPGDGGVVLVIEDLSELIAAQRASAWQEVARRMAHEIKNPLTPIQLSAERIAKRFDRSGHVDNGGERRINDQGPLGEVVHQSTETILREVSSLKMMVDEFSQFARLPEVELSAGDIAEVIRQSVATFEGRFPNIEIRYAENRALPEIMQDGEQLKRVFVNLIDNAVEAFEPEQSERSVTITARHEAARDLVVAEVTDNGKGIAPSDLQKLFQPYFSTKGRGTGLGLAIVKRIVLEHHGRINVVTNSPHGAKFIIELPVGG